MSVQIIFKTSGSWEENLEHQEVKIKIRNYNQLHADIGARLLGEERQLPWWQFNCILYIFVYVFLKYIITILIFSEEIMVFHKSYNSTIYL